MTFPARAKAGVCPFCGARMEIDRAFKREPSQGAGRWFLCPTHRKFFITDQAEGLVLTFAAEEKEWLGKALLEIPESERQPIDTNIIDYWIGKFRDAH